MVVGQQLGRAIKERRLALGLTQAQAAAAVSALAAEPITTATFSEWERSKSAPHPRNIGPLAEWMGVTVSRVAMMAEDAERPEDATDEALVEDVRKILGRIDALETRLYAMQDAIIEQQKAIIELMRRGRER